MEVIELPGIGSIKVRRGIHIKYLRLRMAPGRGVWVSVPWGASKKQVMQFLEENRAWILQHRKELESYERDTGVGLKIGAEIPTKLHVLKIQETSEKVPHYRLEGKVLTLFIPKGTDFTRIEGVVGRFLLEVYRLECQQYLPQRVKGYAERYGFRYGKLTFRDNVSNWGSCSYENNISLNIKLMKLPDELIDYVILHELCHTVEKNHSAAFWELVGKVCPDYARLRHELRQYNTRI